MTLSIAAWDEHSGQLGAAISSSSISVASRCLHWRPGVGIALSQNITDPRLGPRMLELLADGVATEAAVQAVAASTPYINYRQLGLVDARGTGALYTGDAVLGCFGSAAGKHCIAAGNLLANTEVPLAMVHAFESAEGSFGQRVVEALVAGVKAGEAMLGLTGRDLIIRYTHVPPVPDWRLGMLMKFEIEEVSEQSGGEVSAGRPREGRLATTRSRM